MQIRELRIIGMAISGLYMTGVPKIIGSEMLKIAGTRPALPTARRRSDLERRQHTARDSMLPAPPAEVASMKVKIGANTVGWPAATSSALVPKAVIMAGRVTTETIP